MGPFFARRDQGSEGPAAVLLFSSVGGCCGRRRPQRTPAGLVPRWGDHSSWV